MSEADRSIPEGVQPFVYPNPEASQQLQDQDMVNMFTSVWVKVEQSDEEFEEEGHEEQDVNAGTSHEDQIVKAMSTKRKYNAAYYKKPSKLLKCEHCEFSTYYRNCLVIHIKTRHLNEYVKCDKCDYVTDNNHALWRHQAIKHIENDKQTPTFNGKELPELKCQHCDYKTFYKWNFNAHQRKHTREKNYKCGECEYATAYRNSYVKHCKTHEEKHNVFYKCDKCPFVTKYAGHIQRHLAKVHNEVSESDNFCDLCDFSTRIRWRLNIHKQKSKQDATQKCEFKECPFETFYKCELKKHKKSHFGEIYGAKVRAPHKVMDEKIQSMATTEIETLERKLENISENLNNAMENVESLFNTNEPNTSNQIFIDTETHSIFQNTIGETSLYDQSSFKNDSKSNENLNDNSSSEMPSPNTNNQKPEKKKTPKGEGLYNEYDLDQECEDQISIQVIESLDESKRYRCPLCDYTSNFKAAVQRHYRRHHTGNTVRPFRCRHCDFTTKTKDQIGLHNKRSLCASEIACSDCGFATIFKCKLIMHQKSHYQYHCSQCTISYRKKSELTRHYAVVHLGSGIKCRFCDYKASRKESVLCHEAAIHTGVKPHKCDHCDYTTVRKALLNKHMAKRHSELKQVITIVNQVDLNNKIKQLQFKVPKILPSSAMVKDGTAMSGSEKVVKICDERVSLSENRVLVGDSIVTIDDKDHVNEENVVSLMGMIGVNMPMSYS